MKYMIHTYPKRLWYVKEHIVRDLLKQGIKQKDIIIVNDTKGLGNLWSFVESLSLITEDTWHLQDDILISKQFKLKTDVLGRMGIIVCGFNHYDFNSGCNLCKGITKPIFMYMSFPCIFIPKRYSDEFKLWINSEITKRKHKEMIETGKCDDQLFYQYMIEGHKFDEIYNTHVSLVDHVDYLLGGSSINDRSEIVRATYWYENDLNIKLEEELKKEGKLK